MFSVIPESGKPVDLPRRQNILQHHIGVIDYPDALARILLYDVLLHCVGYHFLEPMVVLFRTLAGVFPTQVIREPRDKFRCDCIHRHYIGVS